MARIRTTFNPTEEIEVSDATRDDLEAQGVLLGPTRATTDKGLTDAAIRQVRERAYTDEMRAGIAEAERRAEQSKPDAKPSKPRAPRRRRARAADTTDPAGEPAVADTANAGGTTGDAAPAAAAAMTSGDVPADTTQES